MFRKIALGLATLGIASAVVAVVATVAGEEAAVKAAVMTEMGLVALTATTGTAAFFRGELCRE